VLVRPFDRSAALHAVHERLAELAEHVEAKPRASGPAGQQAGGTGWQGTTGELASTITRLGRTQFKSNTLGGDERTASWSARCSPSRTWSPSGNSSRSRGSTGVKYSSRRWRREARGALAAELLPVGQCGAGAGQRAGAVGTTTPGDCRVGAAAGQSPLAGRCCCRLRRCLAEAAPAFTGQAVPVSSTPTQNGRPSQTP